jgi:hypothetical protein
MSTPTGRPFGPINISDYAPKRVRDRLAAQGGRDRDDQPDTPDGPEQEPAEAAFEAAPDEQSDEPQSSPLAPLGAHERSAAAWDDGEPDDGRAYDVVPEDRDEDAYADEDAYPTESAYAKPTARRPYVVHRAAYEVDLDRLEADLEDLRQDGGDDAVRLPPAGQLPPPWMRRRSGETYIEGHRLPPSLEPSYLPPPPMRERTNHMGMVLRVFFACAVAAPVAYFLVYYFSVVTEPSTARRKPAPVETQIAALPPMPAVQPSEAPAPPPPPTPALPAQASPQPAATYTPQSVAPSAPQSVAPSTPPSVAPNWPTPRVTTIAVTVPQNPAPAPVRRPVIAIDPDEIAILLRQGEQFIAAGDVVTARVPFARAAEAGDAKAALALGATYDPAVLVKLGVRGIAPDVAKARSWYEKARDLGSSEATARLENLAIR